MAEQRLNDRVWRGLGAAARAIGDQVDAYRPTDSGDPLRPSNRFLRLPAAFTAPRVANAAASRSRDIGWEGVFDAAYTLPGDYLVRDDEQVWFVAAQPAMEPTLCVRARRRLSFSRPSGPVMAGANLYGGVVRSTAARVLTRWPAAMATEGIAGPGALATSSGIPQGTWSILLPPLAWLGLLAGDTMSDDLGRAGVVESADYTELGWRLQVRQATA
jgi:hypothetical protein